MRSERFEVPMEVVARQVGTETVILHLETGLYYGLDPVGTAIWNHIGAGKTVEQTCEAMLAAYEVTAEVLTVDVDNIVAELLEKGLLTVVKP